MNAMLPLYTHGTHRLALPEETLARIAPHLRACGITRCADVTALDNLQLPTYCAIRPEGLVLQTCNGKGASHAAAKASALMEAIELHHSEHPLPARLRRATLRTLLAENTPVIHPRDLDGFHDGHWSDDFPIEWTEGEDLATGGTVLLPASAVYFGCEPAVHANSTNGLASGNHLVEATLHALYELIERDAGSKLSVNGSLKIRERCRIVDVETVTDPELRETLDVLFRADCKLLLFWLESCVPVHTFWAMLLNKSPFSAVSTLNTGWGTHLNVAVAASRAVTEAIQSRLTFIHGAREDIMRKPVYNGVAIEGSEGYRYFDRLTPNTTWPDVAGRVPVQTFDFEECQRYLIRELIAAGHPRILRCDLTDPQMGIPVVKVLVPTLRFHRKIF
jgi:ribosomal protein S12 methylthiotransferase accessory factor